MENSLSSLIIDYNNTKDEHYLKQAIELIKAGNVNKLGFIFKKDFLYYVDETGKTFLDYLLSYNIPMSDMLLDWILEDIRVVKKFIEYNKYDFNEAYENVLFGELEPGKLLIDYMFENDLMTPSIIGRVENHLEVVNYLVKYEKLNLLESLSEYILFAEYKGGKRIIDFLFENNKVDKKIIKRIDEYPEIYDLLVKYNRLDLVKELGEDLLSKKRDNKDVTLLEELANTGLEINSFLNRKESLEVFLRLEKYDYLCNLRECQLLTIMDNSKSILETLLEKGLTPNTYLYSDVKSAELFVKYDRYDLLCKCDISVLSKNVDLNNKYIDLLLNKYKEDPKSFNITTLNIFGYDNETLAKIYMSFANNGLMVYVGYPTDAQLMKKDSKGRRLVDELLNIDEKATIDLIIANNLVKNIDLYLYLRIKGIKAKGLVFNNDKTALSEEYFQKINAEIATMPIPAEAEAILNDFRTVMLNDGKSDPEKVNLIITGYRKAISLGNMQALREIELLINAKNNNPGISIVTTTNGACFGIRNKSINLNSSSLDTSNHEVGHAMYDLLTDKIVPPNYQSIVERIRNNPEVLEKINEYSKKYFEAFQKIVKFVDEEYKDEFDKSFGLEKKQQIEDYLAKTKEEKIKEYESLGYSEEELNGMISDVFTYDEYVKQNSRAKKFQLASAIMENEYPELCRLSDIIDSIFEGKYIDGELTTKNGEKIIGYAGHGINYYMKRGIGVQFDENIANISAIYKCSKPNEALANLRNIVGEEFVNMMVNYYQENIINSRKFDNERSI